MIGIYDKEYVFEFKSTSDLISVLNVIDTKDSEVLIFVDENNVVRGIFYDDQFHGPLSLDWNTKYRMFGGPDKNILTTLQIKSGAPFRNETGYEWQFGPKEFVYTGGITPVKIPIE